MSTATVIDAQLVKTLRERTNAGLMECKKALAETNGDLESAVDVLRKKGTIKAAESAGKEAKEGVIAQAILPGAKVGVLVEVNCQTDFVAKNESFKAFADDIAKKIALDPKVDLEADRIAAFQAIKENIVIRRSDRRNASHGEREAQPAEDAAPEMASPQDPSSLLSSVAQ